MTALSTPKELGYRLPAEWEPQATVWFAWPTRDDLWVGVLPRVRAQLAALYVLAARFQPVSVLCPQAAQTELQALMAQAGDARAVTLYDYQTDDVWCRDYGPLFLLSADGSEIGMTDWVYNAWGNKFPLQQRDNAASAWMADHLGLRRFAQDTVLEGGAIESNGAGQLLTTEVVLLNPNRNGAVTRQQIEATLVNGLGIQEVLWLQDGLDGDDTDGHIDNLARFFKPDGILVASVDDPQDSNALALSENMRRIEAFRTPAGRPYTLIPLPLPDPIYVAGERLAASYMNFLVLNGAVLVPTYAQPERDAHALAIIAECYPGREIVGFDCRDIVREGGAIHCMSQHQPAPVSIRQ
jgi:agmatine deiminase